MISLYPLVFRPRFYLVTAIAGGAFCSLSAPRSAIADDRKACIDAHYNTQVLRDEGKLLHAKQQIATCLANATACPQVVLQQCQKWQDEIDAQIPTVIFRAHDAQSKADLSVARVTVDGSNVPEAMNGLPYSLDPGQHSVRFESHGYRSTESSIVVVIGEKSRVVDGELQPDVGTAPSSISSTTQDSGGKSTATWAFGTLSFVGFATFGVSGVIALNDYNTLKKTCGPNCSNDSVSRVRAEAAVADIGLGVGILSLGLATFFFFHDKTSSPPPVSITIGPQGVFAVGSFHF